MKYNEINLKIIKNKMIIIIQIFFYKENYNNKMKIIIEIRVLTNILRNYN